MIPRNYFLLNIIIIFFPVYISFYKDYYQYITQIFLFINHYNFLFSCIHKILKRFLPKYDLEIEELLMDWTGRVDRRDKGGESSLELFY